MSQAAVFNHIGFYALTPKWQCFFIVAGARRIFEEGCAAEGVPMLFWREVSVDDHDLGATARACMPTILQAFVACRARARSARPDGFRRASGRAVKSDRNTASLRQQRPELFSPSSVDVTLFVPA